MPKYGKQSKAVIITCSEKIQVIVNDAIEIVDLKALSGLREAEEQFGHFKKGRELIGGVWTVVNPGKVVTWKDGYNKLSKHQIKDSDGLGCAIDIVPYPVSWTKLKPYFYAAGIILGIAFEYGIMLEWGYNKWGWDMPHFQLAKSER